MVRVPREPVGRRRRVGVRQRDVVERVPAVDELAGLEVVLLDCRIDDRAVVRAAVLAEVHRDVLVRRHPGVVAADLQLVQRQCPAVDATQGRDRPVVLVDDDVLAGLGRAGARDHALPPRERRLALVGLHAQVRRDDIGWHRPEPDRLQVVVEHQWAALTDDRRGGQVVEVRGHDVAGCEPAAAQPSLRRRGSPAGAGSAPRRSV